MTKEQRLKRMENIFYYGFLFVSTFLVTLFMKNVALDMGKSVLEYLMPLLMACAAFGIAVRDIVIHLFFTKKEPVNE